MLPCRPIRALLTLRMIRAVCVAALVGMVCVLAVVTDGAAQRRSHTVRRGDTIASIARRYGVTQRELRAHNRIRGNAIVVGRSLSIPSARGRRDMHQVGRGDTLTKIARRYGVTTKALARANRLRGSNVRLGQRLRIPGRTRENPVRRPRRPVPHPLTDEQRADAERRTRQLVIGSRFTAQRLLRLPARESWIEAAREAPRRLNDDGLVEGDTGEMGTLGLPVNRGRYMRGWGSGPGGYHLALDVAGGRGVDIRASERGIVVYSGHEISGYGNFVLIAHPNGLVTAYAHNEQNFVISGQYVTRGQVIATLGDSGLARGPHLHYIVVHQGEHCDSVPMLRPFIERRGGEVVEAVRARWRTRQPEAVRCLPRSARPHPRHGRRRR